MRKRAIELTSIGLPGKACKALSKRPPAQVNPDIVEEMENKVMTHLHITITKNTIFAHIKSGRTCKTRCELMHSAYFYHFREER